VNRSYDLERVGYGFTSRDDVDRLVDTPGKAGAEWNESSAPLMTLRLLDTFAESREVSRCGRVVSEGSRPTDRSVTEPVRPVSLRVLSVDRESVLVVLVSRVGAEGRVSEVRESWRGMLVSRVGVWLLLS